MNWNNLTALLLKLSMENLINIKLNVHNSVGFNI